MTVYQQTKYEHKANDLYETPYWVTEALLRHVNVAGLVVWEPAAGNHKVADILTLYGARLVLTSDIETYGREHSLGLLDFTAVGPGIIACDAIVTNPPYGVGNRLAARFARHALACCTGWVAILATAKFDSGRTRVDIFRDNHRFRYKITLLRRIRWVDGPDSRDGTEDHAWFVWGPSDSTPPSTPRLIWE